MVNGLFSSKLNQMNNGSKHLTGRTEIAFFSCEWMLFVGWKILHELLIKQLKQVN